MPKIVTQSDRARMAFFSNRRNIGAQKSQSPRIYRALSSLLQQMQSADISQVAVCRICYSGENSGPKSGEPLISPCNCKGTIGLYHRTCLKKWLMSSNTWVCEICRFRFEVKRKLRSFMEYLRDDSALCEQKTLCTDLLCFIILTPLVFLSVIICISLAIEFHYNYDHDNVVHSKTALAIGLLVLSFVLFLAYCSWIIVTWIFHRKSFFCWQRLNLDFEVMDQLSAEDSILINGLPNLTPQKHKRSYSQRTSTPSRFQFLVENSQLIANESFRHYSES